MTAEQLIAEAEASLIKNFQKADKISEYNQEKVLKAFNKHSIALRHFNGTTGYGYGDDGRFALGAVFADCMGAEAGIVSPALLSGTHALSVALFGVLRTGDSVLCISGMPYDTIRGVIFGEGNGSLKDYGISFDCTDLTAEGKFDKSAIEKEYARLNKNLKIVFDSDRKPDKNSSTAVAITDYFDINYNGLCRIFEYDLESNFRYRFRGF